MKKIRAVPYFGEMKSETCSITGAPFHQVPGLCYSVDGKPIAPSVAIRAGFEMHPDVMPPEEVKTKEALTGWIRSLGLKPGSVVYETVFGLQCIIPDEMTRYTLKYRGGICSDLNEAEYMHRESTRHGEVEEVIIISNNNNHGKI